MSENATFDFGDPACVNIDLPDAEAAFYAQAFSCEEADSFLMNLLRDTPWRNDRIVIHGQQRAIPRLQTWYSRTGAALNYSGLRIPALPLSDELARIHKRVEEVCAIDFNSVLVTQYRDGNDSVSWHSDDETEWGPDPIIASVSFGATRDFMFKHKSRVNLKTITLPLSHGSLFLMGRGTQVHWRHQLPKRKRVDAPRINLTFRQLLV